MNFYGYKRPDGRVGVRNKVLILPASVCASDTTRIIAQQVVGAVTFNNQQGCSQVASDQQLTMDVMAGYAANPNVYGTVVVSLGCENCQMDLVVEAIKERTNKPLKQVIIQEAGGTLKAIDMAVRYAKEMVEEASLLQREEFPMSELIIGTECGVLTKLKERRPDAEFYFPETTPTCVNMKKITPEKVLHVLKTGENEIHAKPETEGAAKNALARMLELAGK